jgi:hypothetical protein
VVSTTRPLLAVLRQVFFQLGDALFVEGGEGFVENPQRRAGRYRRAKATRRCWPADKVWQGTSSKPAGRRRPGPARWPRGKRDDAGRRAS